MKSLKLLIFTAFGGGGGGVLFIFSCTFLQHISKYISPEEHEYINIPSPQPISINALDFEVQLVRALHQIRRSLGSDFALLQNSSNLAIYKMLYPLRKRDPARVAKCSGPIT